MKALGLVRSQPILGAVMVMLLVPMVLAAFVPVFAPIPEATAGWVAPPLPERDEPLGDFQHLLEPLPIVVRDLPDDESQAVVGIYDDTRFTDNESAMEMLAAAEEAIPIPAHLEDTWNFWLDLPEDRPIPSSVMAVLVEDPRNADRLSNLAVAMYFSVFTLGEGNKMHSWPVGKSLDLLGYTIDAFPGNRAALLNRMFLESVTWLTLAEDSRLPEFHDWIVSHPLEATALQLAVQLYLNSWATDDSERAEFLIGIASQYLEDEDPARVAFGHAVIGDVYIGNLRWGAPLPEPARSPFSVRHNARRALERYDTALLYSNDPSIYTARATTLMLLGDERGALEARQRAVDLIPESMSLRLLLSEAYRDLGGTVEERRGNISYARDLTREVVRMALDSDGAFLSDVQIISSFQRVHLVSSRSERLDVYLAPGMAGGGYAIAFTEIPEATPFPSMSIGGHPVSRAAWGANSMSEALGDPDGAADDAANIYNLADDPRWEGSASGSPLNAEAVQGNIERSRLTARLVKEGSSASSEDLADYFSVINAARWLRIMGEPQKAAELCQAAAALQPDDSSASSFHDCVAESLFMAGDYSAAQDVYVDLSNTLYAGYVAEYTGDLAEAERYYRSGLDRESFVGYTSMLRLGGVLLEQGDSEGAEEAYTEWIDWADSGAWATADGWSLTVDEVMPYAYSNRGIARLQMSADRNGDIDCADDDHEACIAAANDFDAALEYDAFNPVFLMNRAWVARLMGDHDFSTQLMERALESDATLYPVLTDMGVYAVESGDLDSARGYFKDAVAANPEYDLGWWNLGVLEMQNGPRGIVRGQAYLARALVRNPSLVTSSLNFKTDESIYRVEIGNANQPGAGWSFGRSSSLATTALGFLGAALIIFRASTHVFKDTIVELVSSKVDSVRPWWDDNVTPRLIQIQSWRGIALALLLATVVVMVLAEVIPVWRGDPTTASASITIAIFALLLAVVVHECGHQVSAKLMGARLEPVQWAPGIGLSLFLLPFNLSSGPFPAQRVTSDDDTDTLWVYLFGPLANLAAAVAIYVVYLNQPLPVLRVIAITQLAVMSYSLLPFEPLDGAALARAQPKLVGGLASFAFLAGVLFSVGII